MTSYTPAVRKEDYQTLAKNADRLSFVTASDWLKNTNCRSLFPEKRTEIVTLDKTDSLSAAFKTLIDHKILSCPVWDAKHSLYDSFLDILDIVNYTIRKVTPKVLGSPSTFDQEVNSPGFFDHHPISHVAGTSGRNQYFAFQQNTPLAIALATMAQNKLHRIAVVDNEGSLETIVTASHIVSLLADNQNKFSVSTEKIENLGLASRAVLSVTTAERALDAFKTICENQISGVAVIDPSKKSLVGNISASDLKEIGYDGKLMSKLFLPVSEFLKLIPVNKELPSPFSVKSSQTLSEVLHVFKTTKTHRIYVIDDRKNPTGVISLTDVIDVMLSSVK